MLNKFLSTAGVASRRKSADLVKGGHVRVNGEIELNPGRRVGDGDAIFCDGKKVEPVRRARHYIMLHKPRGYVCTCEDEHAAKKAIDLIDTGDGARLFSAGRLDKNSEGLILFSDDGDFVEQLTHPSHEVRKTYEVSTDRPLTAGEKQKLLSGIRSDGEILRALAVRELQSVKYALVLGEGKNREIRRMMEFLKIDTKRLKRVAVGSLRLGGLPCGQWRELTPAERAAATED